MTAAIARIAHPKPKLLTAEDLLRLDSKGVKGELIRGEFCETVSVGVKHGEVVIKLGFLMGSVVVFLIRAGVDTARP